MTLSLEFDICEKISYTMYHNHLKVVSKAEIINEGDVVESLDISISSTIPFFKPFVKHADRIAARSTLDLLADPTFSLDLYPEYFANLTENIHSVVTVEIKSGGNVLALGTFNVELLTYDMWPGLNLMPEMIASFVTPNVDSLAPLRARASDILAKWGCDTSFDGYARGNDAVMKMVAAIYTAVCEQNINYILPPTDFGQNGQRIRLSDEIMKTKQGTCIDLATLFASLFESIRLDPVIFFITGHAFVGVHLARENVPKMVEFNNTYYRADIDGNAFCAIECTMAVNSNLGTFEEARKRGYDNLANADEFYCAVEIYNAHHTIRPLPMRRMVGDQWIVDRENITLDAKAPERVGSLDTALEFERKLTKVERWKRELLDLSTRNYLIKMKLGRKVVPLLIPDIGEIEDKLSEGLSFKIIAKPLEWDGNSHFQIGPFETDKCLGSVAEIFEDDLRRKFIHTPYTELETEKTLRLINRQAISDLEESGCNSLFLEIGTLKWYDTKSKDIANYAPLILIPVQIKKTIRGFTIEKLDEDTLFNVTLQEKLRQEFDILLPIPDPLPSDESGVDVASIIQTVRLAVKNKPRWEVFEGSALGIFNFSQYAMWKDLDSNIKRYKQNPIVRGLADSVPYPADYIVEDADPYKGCLVVHADGSQVKAINASLNHSFVMHGPPGTGKSQTITNMIANAMMNGKTVLFVAEKRAALEVVKKRLDNVGIGNHCLELHSNKTVKSEVLGQLRNAFDSVEKYEPSELVQMREKLERAKLSLDKYARELHQPMIAKYSMYDLISRFEDNDIDDVVELRYLGEISQATEESIEEIENLVRDAVILADHVAEVDKSDLDQFRLNTANISIEQEAIDLIDDLRNATLDLKNSGAVVEALKRPLPAHETEKLLSFYESVLDLKSNAVYDENSTSYPERIDALNTALTKVADEFSTIAEAWSSTAPEKLTQLMNLVDTARSEYEFFVNRGYLEYDNYIKDMLESVSTYCTTMGSVRNELDSIETKWDRKIFRRQDVASLYARYKDANNAGFLKKGKARKEFLASVNSELRNINVKYESLEETLCQINKNANAGSELIRLADKRFQVPKVLTQFKSDCEKVRNVRNEFNLDAPELKSYYDNAKQDRAKVDDFIGKQKVFDECLFKLNKLLVLNEAVYTYPGCIRFSEELCEKVDEISEYLYDIAQWHAIEQTLENNGLKEITPYLLEGIEEDILVHSAYRAFYKACLETCRKSLEGMRTFGPVAFEKAIRSFKKYDKKYTELNAGLLKCTLYQNLPSNTNTVAGTETYTLMKAIQATRMRKSIRSLISEIPNVLLKVCPCFLMSPLSVSQYLSPDFPLFDMVIFDESSQITTPKAICCLGKAKGAIIAGDNKQLPPTSFFQKKIEDEGDEDMIDVDSFLDDCLALNMPETYLEWHYRSRHESLIAFSNKMYYGSKMLTFPSSNDGEVKVSAVKIQDGCYERGTGKNVPEAKAVVDEIYRRVMSPELSKMSIGVIAFGVKQQGCIQDLLDDRAGRDETFFEKLNNMPEGVFVKNLETVQGDERDVILFSIGYGKTKNGTVYQNFGPINQTGGGRRLNVAVSRARCEMKVFTSMDYTDIKYTPSTGAGVRGMREFLRFAMNNGHFDEQDRTVKAQGDSSILTSIAGELQAAGYICHYRIGVSSFHVDLAVVDPKKEGHYLLGILGDGDSYKHSDNTRDREYARTDVLKEHGWNIIQVWSVEWYSDSNKVIERILERLHNIESGQDNEEAEESDDEVSKTRVLMSRDITAKANSRRRDYLPSPIVSDPEYQMLYSDPITIIRTVIASESPIDEKYLIKIVGKLMGMKKVSENARQRILMTLHNNFIPVKEGSFTTYWKLGERTCDYYRVSTDGSVNRKIEYISLPELRAAVVDAVGMAGSVDIDNVITAVARVLGYSRTGATIRETIKEVILMEIEDGHIVTTNDGRITLP